ncbi:non-heme iron oxygenase ferredoxin subunit [Bradyrhizobium sp. Tv2a-2]|uniref:non-heme iron oxygenase ferredoxin subunit n=1 Tax=Bradyrhizobium sp. Tv2a-2 TaxID=113395 RepID=UPI000425E1E1|nr:non-heme iron oxygenase ferredoxin subunit [Bradyrhizobium sp. Tv2a-2]
MSETWQHICPAVKLGEGESLGFKFGEQRLALYRVDDQIFATDDVCPHAFALLSTGFLDGHVIECPLHAGMFDVRTGKCTSGGYRDVRTFAVEVREGEIYINLETRAAEQG